VCGFGDNRVCRRAGTDPERLRSPRWSASSAGRRQAPTIGCAVWLHASFAARAATHAENRASDRQPHGNDHQAFVSWLCVAWVVLALCQLAVTVAGNLAVIPLTGVTFPFVSFGITSLVVNMAMLGLAVNLNADHEGENG
jgi:cell division protein FtsW (lipid II flippase)